jgi:hypothetical protein
VALGGEALCGFLDEAEEGLEDVEVVGVQEFVQVL